MFVCRNDESKQKEAGDDPCLKKDRDLEERKRRREREKEAEKMKYSYHYSWRKRQKATMKQRKKERKKETMKERKGELRKEERERGGEEDKRCFWILRDFHLTMMSAGRCQYRCKEF